MEIAAHAMNNGAAQSAQPGRHTDQIRSLHGIITGTGSSESQKVEAFADLQALWRNANVGDMTQTDRDLRLQVIESDAVTNIRAFAARAASQMNSRVHDMNSDEHWQLGVLDKYSESDQRKIMVGLGWDSSHESLDALRSVLTRQHEEDLAMRAEANGAKTEDSVELSDAAQAHASGESQLDLTPGEIDSRAQAALNIMNSIVENARQYQRLGLSSRQGEEQSALETFIRSQAEGRQVSGSSL